MVADEKKLPDPRKPQSSGSGYSNFARRRRQAAYHYEKVSSYFANPENFDIPSIFEHHSEKMKLLFLKTIDKGPMAEYKEPTQKQWDNIRKKMAKIKRVRSSYIYFVKANFDKVTRDHPGFPFGKISSLLGKKWRHMSMSERSPYNEMHKRDKEDYYTKVRRLWESI